MAALYCVGSLVLDARNEAAWNATLQIYVLRDRYRRFRSENYAPEKHRFRIQI